MNKQIDLKSFIMMFKIFLCTKKYNTQQKYQLLNLDINNMLNNTTNFKEI